MDPKPMETAISEQNDLISKLCTVVPKEAESFGGLQGQRREPLGQAASAARKSEYMCVCIYIYAYVYLFFLVIVYIFAFIRICMYSYVYIYRYGPR